VALAEDDGDVIERYWYEPYGSVTFADSAGVERTEAAALNKTLLFQGRRYDPETGFYYYRNRYYSPVLGRFLQRDPAGYQDGMSLYTFLISNPLYSLDPEGLNELQDQIRDQIGDLNETLLKKAAKGASGKKDIPVADDYIAVLGGTLTATEGTLDFPQLDHVGFGVKRTGLRAAVGYNVGSDDYTFEFDSKERLPYERLDVTARIGVEGILGPSRPGEFIAKGGLSLALTDYFRMEASILPGINTSTSGAFSLAADLPPLLGVSTTATASVGFLAHAKPTFSLRLGLQDPVKFSKSISFEPFIGLSYQGGWKDEYKPGFRGRHWEPATSRGHGDDYAPHVLFGGALTF